ncbi:MAG: hypothetical protein N3A54_02240 [Patescibacteria group bacterium]|nr:hypothetical protein [Patescibacteria group bacterium]
MIEFKSFIKNLQETNQDILAVSDFYFYFGWITPNGEFLTPYPEKVKTSSHFDIIRNRFRDEEEAFNNGYVKVIGESYYKGDIHFEAKWRYAKNDIDSFVESFVRGLKNIEEMIVSGKMCELFGCDFIPLPKSLVIFFGVFTISVKKYISPSQAGRVLKNALLEKLQEEQDTLNETIVKRDGKYYLYSKDGSRKLGGPYRSRKQALKRERQVQYFKHLNEANAPQDYYYYYGWIAPSGRLILPKNRYYAHVDMLPERFSGEMEAIDEGYIRFISEKYGLYFESSLKAAHLFGPENFKRVFSQGIKNIENSIIEGKFGEIFGHTNIPLPQNGRVEFFPHNLGVSVYGSLNNLPQMAASKLQEFFTKSKIMEARVRGRIDPDWFPSRFYFYYGLITPEGDVILPTSVEDQPTHAHMMAALGLTSVKVAMNRGYVRFLVELDTPTKISLETTEAFINNVGGKVASETLLKGVRKIEELIMSGEISEKFDLSRVPLPQYINVYVDEKASRTNIPIDRLREGLKAMFYESFTEEKKKITEYYMYFGWFNPDGEFFFPEDPINDLHYTIIKNKFSTMGKAMDSGWVRFVSENRWIGKDVLNLECSIDYVKKVGAQNFVSYVRKNVKKLEEMIMNGELRKRFFDREIPLPDEYGIYIRDIGEVRGPENVVYSMLLAKLNKELQNK